MVSNAAPDLWTLALDQPQFAAGELAGAMEREIEHGPLDFRTRLLIRDGINALRDVWGEDRLNRWLSQSPRRDELNEIRQETLGKAGFPSLARRIMDTTRTETVLQFFRELGQIIQSPTTMAVGGSVALILAGLLNRRTEDIDVVDEIPLQIRSHHDLLAELAQRYSLALTHFQSHYLPTGWESRLASLGKFGLLEVQRVDPRDIFLGKLFSARDKDRDDLRILARQLDKNDIIRHLPYAANFIGEEILRKNAEKNWYVLYGEQLPTEPIGNP
jgi:hypothetical protein